MSTDTVDITPADLRKDVKAALSLRGFEATAAFLVREALGIETRVTIESDRAVTRLSFQSREFSIEVKKFLDQSPHAYTVKHLRRGVTAPAPYVAYEGPSALDALCEGLLEAHINSLFW